jgi:serine/threonine protein kinase, bacterial
VTLAEGALVGPYRLGGLLGRGGMAVVYEATHESIGRTVALKLVSPDLADADFVERFRREGRMQASLQHPHVVTVYEAGTSEYGPYLAMRLIRGTTLAQLVNDGELSASRALRLVGQVADALDAAHASGMVHRDVKPRNVLVGDDDHAYLADFGLTKRSDAVGATMTGHFMGTLAYAAPEVLRGDAAGPASDRYALAAVLFECLTGTNVFPRPSHAAVVYAHMNEPPPRVSGRREGVPPALDEALIAGLAKDPGERPATAAALVARAGTALNGDDLGPPAPRILTLADDDATTTGETTVAAGPAPRRGSRRSTLALVLPAIVAAAVGGAVVTLFDDGGGSASARAELPAPPAGTQRLGSDLAHAGRTVDCRGGRVGDSSPACTVFQNRLRATTLVVQRDGVVRRWGLRSAVGEFALTVMRRRDEGYFQIARSRNEFVGNGAPHFFAADLAVEQGDRLGLVALEGAGFGVHDDGGGATGRFLPPLRGLIVAPKDGARGELLLRVDYLPGGKQRLPEQVTGAVAAVAPEGEILARRRVRFSSGRRIEVRVVMIDGRGMLDVMRGDRRIARIGVPGLRAPAGDTLQLVATASESTAEWLGIDVRFTRPGSARLESHYYDYVAGEGFTFVD